MTDEDIKKALQLATVTEMRNELEQRGWMPPRGFQLRFPMPLETPCHGKDEGGFFGVNAYLPVSLLVGGA